MSQKGPGRCQRGSAVVLVLFACLVVTVSIQAVTTAAICADRALLDEVKGREKLARVDACLADLACRASQASVSGSVSTHAGEPGYLKGRLTERGDSWGWLLRAEVSEEETFSQRVISATVERGRDGVDLPQAALVATRVRVAQGRQTPWLEREPSVEDGAEETTTADDAPEVEGPATVAEAYGYVQQVEGPEVLGSGCGLRSTSSSWSLGEGWREYLSVTSLGPRVVVLSGLKGQTVTLPRSFDESSESRPLLIVVTGGADIDLSGKADLWAVVVQDGGSVSLDGTVLHGAVVASGDVELGGSGAVMFCQHAFSWATDRALSRARLVPGTRIEDTD